MQPSSTKIKEIDIDGLVKAGLAGWANVPKSRSFRSQFIPPEAGSVLVEPRTGCIILSDEGKVIARRGRKTFNRAIRFNLGQFRNHLSTFEGSISFMYLDSEGHVTVGLGHLLDDADEAKNLPFLRRRTNEFAHPKHIENAFNLVLKSGRQGEPAENFKNITHIDLSRSAIELLFNADVIEFLPLIKSEFPDFETYPASAQLGMLDLAYTLGARGLKDGFPVFGRALEFRNWIEVADQSGREAKKDKKGNPNAKMVARNSIVRRWFLDAIKVEPFFLNPECSPKRI